MDPKTKNAIGIAGVVVGLMIGFAALSYADAYSQSIQPSSFRSFSVTGDAKVVAVPDVATFTFGLTTEGGKDIGALQADNTNKMNAAIAYLKSQGIAAKDITTENYNLTPRYQYFQCGPIYPNPFIYGSGSTSSSSGSSGGGSTVNGSMPAPAPTVPTKVCPPSEIVGYTISQTVLVKVRDFTKIGTVLSGVIQNGANNTSGLNFTIDDPTTLQNQARAQAIAKAKAQAQAIADAAGFRLGRLLSIEENSNNFRPVYYDLSAGAPKESPAPSPTIEPGSQDVTATVTLRYEIQ